MDKFLLVLNICPSDSVFLCNNLSYQICETLWPSQIHTTRIDMDWQYEAESLHNHHG